MWFNFLFKVSNHSFNNIYFLRDLAPHSTAQYTFISEKLPKELSFGYLSCVTLKPKGVHNLFCMLKSSARGFHLAVDSSKAFDRSVYNYVSNTAYKLSYKRPSTLTSLMANMIISRL